MDIDSTNPFHMELTRILKISMLFTVSAIDHRKCKKLGLKINGLAPGKTWSQLHRIWLFSTSGRHNIPGCSVVFLFFCFLEDVFPNIWRGGGGGNQDLPTSWTCVDSGVDNTCYFPSITGLVIPGDSGWKKKGMRSRRQDGTQAEHNVTCLCPSSPKSKGLGTLGPSLVLQNQNLTAGEPGKHREALTSYNQNQSAAG